MPDPLAADVTVAGSGPGARALARALQRARGVRLAAFAGGAGAPEAAREHGVAAYASLRDALTKRPPGTLAVCTPSHLHPEHAELALAAGWDVLVDKPLALSAARARQLSDAAAAANRTLGVMHQYRCDPAHRFLHGALREGELGAVAQLTVALAARRGPEYYTRAPWRGERRLGGGVVWNQAFHVWDLLQWWLGPLRVASARVRPGTPADRDVACELHDAHGTSVHVVARTSAGPAHALTIDVVAERARIDVRDHWRASWTAADSRTDARLAALAGANAANASGYDATNPYVAIVEGLVDGAPHASCADAIAAISLVEAIYASADAGRGEQ